MKIKIGIDIDVEAQHYPLGVAANLLSEVIDELFAIQGTEDVNVKYPIEFDKLENGNDKGYLQISIEKVEREEQSK